jgi:hypothetical protein
MTGPRDYYKRFFEQRVEHEVGSIESCRHVA